MKKLSLILILVSAVIITSFMGRDDICFYLGNKKCFLKQSIIKPGAITFIALHDNENTAVEAYHSWTEQLNINLLELHQRNDRYLQYEYLGRVYEVDPNMMFTDAGREKTLRRNNTAIPAELKKLVKSFADSLLQIIIDTGKNKYTIAVHNNTPDNFSVLTYKNSKNAADIFIAKEEDIDDFFIVTDTADFNYIKNMNLNVVLQSQTPEDDGSLSVYCHQNGIPYINVEAEHGHKDKQIDMIKVVYDLVNEKKIPE